MELAYDDKLVKDDNGIKCRLDRQDLFDGTVDAKRMKTKASKETILAFPTLITKNQSTRKNLVDNGTEFAREFSRLCKAEGT